MEWGRVQGRPEVLVQVWPEVEVRPVDGDLPDDGYLPQFVDLLVVAVRPADGVPVGGEPVLVVVRPKPAELLLRRRRRDD